MRARRARARRAGRWSSWSRRPAAATERRRRRRRARAARPSGPRPAAPTGRSGSRPARGRCSATATPPRRLYREAIERLGRVPHRVHLARAHLVYGEWLRRENRRSTPASSSGPPTTCSTGSAPRRSPSGRAGELLATGETVRKRTRRTRDELTPQEAQIARLAARGPHEPRDRRPALHQPADRRVPPPQGVHQARHQLPPPAPRRPGPAGTAERLSDHSGSLTVD